MSYQEVVFAPLDKTTLTFEAQGDTCMTVQSLFSSGTRRCRTLNLIEALREEYQNRYRLVKELMPSALPKNFRVISRRTVFISAVESIWSSQANWSVSKTFLSRCSRQFSSLYDYRRWARMTDEEVRELTRQLHKKKIASFPSRALTKWTAVRNLAVELKKYKNDVLFRHIVFEDKVYGKDLTRKDAEKISNLQWPYIRKAGAIYIIQRLGAPVLICDKKIQKFMEEYQINSCDELERLLQKAKIPAKMFNVVNSIYYSIYP